jgi:hypothetical protein
MEKIKPFFNGMSQDYLEKNRAVAKIANAVQTLPTLCQLP